MSYTRCNQYPDCESCVFVDMDTPICEECEDADQWEPADPMEATVAYATSRKVVKIKKARLKEAA